ncbi:MAG: hypothetical protein NXY57DRAFT_1041907 [Lentinula lateritia]|uniref:Uncharacterized protein n=1 Tax=Lentinula lateritia TaxID=40482 RepID=A0ABQ8V538_9AGAR|nr:MAG: hypothetical protein NXY57DRAFT_1041907 [Lentinula lateritia]KAJ4471201.1 hypothetical protein C8R41DRAFT_870648 [Lentinula lateritia]
MTPVEQELISSSGQIAFFNSRYNSYSHWICYVNENLACKITISIAAVFLGKLSMSNTGSVTNVLVFKVLFMVFLCCTTDTIYFGGFNLTVIRSMFIWQSFPDTATAMLVDSTDNAGGQFTDSMETMAWRYMPGWKWTATVNNHLAGLGFERDILGCENSCDGSDNIQDMVRDNNNNEIPLVYILTNPI